MSDEVEYPLSHSVRKLDIREDSSDLFKDFEKLSPDSQASVQVLMQNIAKGDVYLNLDENGQQILEYQESRKNSYVDASKANIIVKPRTEDDVHNKVEACLELISYLKSDKQPAGVELDSTKMVVRQGRYREGFEFTRTKQVLGSGNSAGDIVVVKDNQRGEQHALKTIMISVFRKQEIQCWVDLCDTGYVPSLYMFTIRDNKVEVHMEILKESVTMRSIIDEHMQKLDYSLIKPFSLYVLNGTLEAISAMHNKNWVHKDLHGGNIMLQKSSKKVLDMKIIDFGMAAKLETPNAGLDFRGFRSDIASVLRIFCALYVTNEFNNVQDIQANWKTGLQKVTSHMAEKDKQELFWLVDLAMGIVHPDDVMNYRNKVKDKLNKALSDLGKSEMEVLKQVAAVLFPEQIEQTQKYSSDAQHGVDDTDHSEIQLDGEDCVTLHKDKDVTLFQDGQATVPDDLILKLRQSTSIGPRVQTED